VRPGIKTIPTTAYEAVEEVEMEGKEIQHVFKHINSSIEADEAEAVGVEHLLRDINDPTTSTLALQIKHKLNGLSGLLDRLQEMNEYLVNVLSGRIAVNNQIIYNFQDMFNLIPNLNVKELVRSMTVCTNDIHLVLYISSLVRSIISLHDLLANKMKYKNMDEILDRSAGVESANIPAVPATPGATEADKEGKDKESKDNGKDKK
jgi:26S proteasome regulatory subunit N8